MPHRIIRIALTILLVVVVALLGWWAGRVTLTSESPVQAASPSRITAKVIEASVGQTLQYNLTVRQETTEVATNLLSGVVTTVGPNFVDVGDTLYTVAGVPAIAARGSVPFYRDLGPEITGPDVAQLQQMLSELGYSQPVTGHWANITTKNVAAWQKRTCRAEAQSKGITPACEIPETIVPLGTLVAFPSLPASVSLGEGLKPGALISAGAPALSVYTGTPKFVLVLGAEQARGIPEGTDVTVHNAELTWPGVTGAQKRADSGSVEIPVTAPGGGALCVEDCGSLKAEESTLLPTDVHVVPEVSGPAIPAAAVRTDGSGASYVIRPDDSRVPVTVIGTGNGLAVIKGLDIGDDIVVMK